MFLIKNFKLKYKQWLDSKDIEPKKYVYPADECSVYSVDTQEQDLEIGQFLLNEEPDLIGSYISIMNNLECELDSMVYISFKIKKATMKTNRKSMENYIFHIVNKKYETEINNLLGA